MIRQKKRKEASMARLAKEVPKGRLAPAAGRPERLVRDLMTEKVFTLGPADSLVALEDLMDARRVRHVPVVDKEGDLVGLVTQRDLSRKMLGRVDDLPMSVERDLLRGRRVREIMTSEPETVEPDTRLSDAAQVLLENKIGCLPVVEGTHLVGILTEADFVRDYLDRR
jgi:CBS domain-containing membrane protein